MGLLSTLSDEYGLSFVEDWYNAIYDWVRSLIKVLLHLGTGKCEIGRICGGSSKGMHTAEMTIECATSIHRSKQLVVLGDIIFAPNTFSVEAYTKSILDLKKLPKENSLLSANLRNCLQHMNLVSLTLDRMVALKNESFADSNPKHLALLEDLWTNLRPNIQRKGGRMTSEWGEVGFQGKDPATDFRGMGMLGLTQLVYFAQHSKLSVGLLQQSQMDETYFPFAATGINVTAFLLELLNETRFHALIYRELDRIVLDGNNSTDGKSVDSKTIQEIMNVVHQLYNLLFLRLGRAWLNSDSQDLMAFPGVFKSFKSEVRGLYPPL